MLKTKRRSHPKRRTSALVPAEHLEQRIATLRGHKVMFDADLAEVYGVDTRILNQAVRRNHHRFPADFTFQVTAVEADSLRSQIVISNVERGGRRYLPYAFTEHGAVMLASVLNSPAAVAASIRVVRAFIQLRAILSVHKGLARKLEALERKSDRQFKVVFETIRQMLNPPVESRKRPIGFKVPLPKK